MSYQPQSLVFSSCQAFVFDQISLLVQLPSSHCWGDTWLSVSLEEWGDSAGTVRVTVEILKSHQDTILSNLLLGTLLEWEVGPDGPLVLPSRATCSVILWGKRGAAPKGWQRGGNVMLLWTDTHGPGTYFVEDFQLIQGNADIIEAALW